MRWYYQEHEARANSDMAIDAPEDPERQTAGDLIAIDDTTTQQLEAGLAAKMSHIYWTRSDGEGRQGREWCADLANMVGGRGAHPDRRNGETGGQAYPNLLLQAIALPFCCHGSWPDLAYPACAFLLCLALI